MRLVALLGLVLLAGCSSSESTQTPPIQPGPDATTDQDLPETTPDQVIGDSPTDKTTQDQQLDQEVDVNDAANEGPDPNVVCVPSSSPQDKRAIVALEYGGASVVDVVARTAQVDAVPESLISTDVALRYAEGRIYAINRYGLDRVVVLDAADYKVIHDFSTGKGTNPQDIAVLDSTHLYVPAFGTGEVLLCDPSKPAGSEIVQPIDLKSLGANPSPTSALLVGNEVFVTLAFIDPNTFKPTRTGMVVVLDTQSNSLVAQFDLHEQDPYTRLQRIPGTQKLIVDNVDDFSGKTGCFEVIDTVARTASCVLDNVKCGGYAIALAPTATGHVYAVVQAGMMEKGKLCHFKLDGTVVNPALSLGNSLLDVALNDRCELYAAEKIVPDGVHVIDPLTDTEITTKPLDLGTPPAFQSSITFLP